MRGAAAACDGRRTTRSKKRGRTHHLAQEALVDVVLHVNVLKVIARGEVQRPPHEHERERDERDLEAAGGKGLASLRRKRATGAARVGAVLVCEQCEMCKCSNRVGRVRLRRRRRTHEIRAWRTEGEGVVSVCTKIAPRVTRENAHSLGKPWRPAAAKSSKVTPGPAEGTGEGGT